MKGIECQIQTLLEVVIRPVEWSPKTYTGRKKFVSSVGLLKSKIVVGRLPAIVNIVIGGTYSERCRPATQPGFSKTEGVALIPAASHLNTKREPLSISGDRKSTR